MAIINGSVLAETYLGLRTNFFQGLMETPTVIDKASTMVKTSKRTAKYIWPGVTPKMREWIGDRVIEQMRVHATSFEIKHWSNGLEVDADDVADDDLGMYSPLARALGEEAAIHEEDQIYDMLNAAFTATEAYDGQYLVDTDHSDVAGVTNSNKTTAALADGAFDAAIAAGFGVKNDKGRAMNVQYTHLWVPPALRATARDIVMRDKDTNGATNPNYQAVEIIVDARLSAAAGGSDTAWFLMDLSKAVKPFIRFRRKDPDFVAMDDPDSPETFKRNAFQYGADYRGIVVPGPWQLIHGSTGAG